MSGRRLARAVVDTNVVISGLILRRGVPYQLLEAWRNRRFRWMISQPLRAELEEVLRRPRIAQKYGLLTPYVDAFLLLVDRRAYLVEPVRQRALTVRDPDDQAVLETALTGAADYLVTGDDDLLSLRARPELAGLEILTPAEFVQRIGVH